MMLFEFHCSDCGNIFEELVKNGSIYSTECPRCASPARRIISAPNLNFSTWMPAKKALIADALGDNVPVSRIPNRPLREI